MGVTIHFEGQLKNEAAYQQLLEEVSSIAKAEGWSSEAIASNVTTLTRVRDEQDLDYVGPIKGIVTSRDEDCDPVRLEFDSDLYVQGFNRELTTFFLFPTDRCLSQAAPAAPATQVVFQLGRVF